MQQGWSTLLLVSLSVRSVLATPIAKNDPATALMKRDLTGVVVAMAPGNFPDCGGKVWSPDELIAAIQQATEYEATDNHQGWLLPLRFSSFFSLTIPFTFSRISSYFRLLAPH